MHTLFAIGIFLSYFMCLLLLRKKHKRTSDYLLAVWFFVIGTHLLEYTQYLSDFWMRHPHFIAVGAGLPFAHPPLFYLYINFSLHSNEKLKPMHILHFLPVVVYYLAISPFYFYSAPDKVRVMSDEVFDFSTINVVASVAIAISGMVYPYLAHRLLKRNHTLIREHFSHEEEVNHRWLKYSIWGVFAIFFVVILVVFLQHVVPFETDIPLDFGIYIIIICYLVFIGYFGIRHKGIFTENIPLVRQKQPEESYKRSGLKNQQARDLHNQLMEVMNHQKPFLKPRLTLGELADMLQVSHHYLSQVINQFEQKNFYDYINYHRVAEFKNRLLQPKYQSYNLLGLALDCGFNSKSSFNLVFKKTEGCTPSEYFRKLNDQNSTSRH